ncbi:MAG: ABC transporter ATP-binding protein/permease [Clostridiales bacterium]|nr:ABC transporter ATP-binding protein/permease [Clostridiales bacterium]
MKNKQPSVMKRLLKMLFSRYKGRLAIVILCIFAVTAGTVSASIFVQQVIDRVIYPGLKFGYAAIKSTMIKLLLTMVCIYGTALCASIIQTQLMAVITQGFLSDVRVALFNKMESLPISYFDRNLRGDIMSTYTNDVDAIRELVSQTIPALVSSSITVLSVFVMMMMYSLWLTIIIVFATVVIFIVSKKVGGGSAKYFRKRQASLARQEGFVEEMMHGLKVVKVFCHEEKSCEDFDRVTEELFQDTSRAHAYANILGPIIHNIGNILYVLTAIVGIVLYILGVKNVSLRGIAPIDIGVVVAFLSMARQFANQFNQVSQQANALVMAMAGTRRVFAILDEPEETDDGYVTLVNAKIDEGGNIAETDEFTGHWAWKHPHGDGSLTYTEVKGDIVLDNVDFGYVPGKTVLHGVSVYAKPTQRIALVGATGAGKTTITNLITRFYDIADGKVRYDGININKIKKADLRRSIGMVLQDTSLFTGTVKENIRYGKITASDEEVYAAAKIANAYAFITRLPDGFDTMITNDGANLSQGQRQLLSIARAAIANAPVLILDEATSSIDTRTEALVQQGMNQLMEGRTVFIIAHRLSTIRSADAIMVMDHGKIIERGTHESLIAEKGYYYRLYTGAFELD